MDEEKAFDRLLWHFRDLALRRFGFGPWLCDLVSLLHTDVQATVQVNGFLSRSFAVQCGVRQGDPASPLLYALVSECLACTLRARPAVVGVPMPVLGHRALISLYADDKDVFLADNNALIAFKDVMTQYEAATGAKINTSKSRAMLLGPSAAVDFPDLHLRVLTDNETISCLGVSVGASVTDHDIWLQVLDKL